MNAGIFDNLGSASMAGVTPFARLDFWSRTILLLIALPLSAVLCSLQGLAVVGLADLIVAVACGRYLHRVLLATTVFAAPFLLLSLVLSLALTRGPLGDQLIAGLLPGLRFFLLVLPGSAFALSSDSWEIPEALARIRIPHRYCIVALVALRMLSLMSRKVRSIYESQAIRGARFSASPRHWQTTLHSLRSLVIPLVLTAFQLSAAFADSLVARGFNLDAQPERPKWNWGPSDMAVLVVAAIVTVLAVTL